MKKLFLTVLVVLNGSFLFSQEDGWLNEGDSYKSDGLKINMGLITRSYSDSVILRWAISNPSVFKIHLESGVYVERAKVNSDGSYGSFEKITTESIKPWTKEQWANYFNSRPDIKDETVIDYESFAYMSFFDDENESNSKLDKQIDIIENITEEKRKSDWQVLFALLSANSSRIAAEGLGLRFVDRNVKLGDKYVYRVSLAGESPVYKVDPGYVELTVESFNPDYAKQSIFAAENDGSIELGWIKDMNLTFYNIDRSEDNGITFKRMNLAPMLTMLPSIDTTRINFEGYADTTITNYIKYVYRIYGTTSFADELLIGEITAMGRDRTPPESPFLPQPEHISDNEVKVSWKMYDNPAPDLAGFNIGRDTSSSGVFNYINSNLIPPTSREYVDTDFIRGGINYYLVEAVDTAGNISQSFPMYVALNDTAAPEKPEWISGKMDSNGVVTLVLKPNQEKDLMGYRILTANDPEHEFSSIIESFGNDTIDYTLIMEFKDTVSLNTTTKYVYYRATAIDNRFNESQFSEIIAVPRPDIIPPVSPVITDVFITDTTVVLTYAPSSSNDVEMHILYKKLGNSEKWDSLIIQSLTDTFYIDLDVKSGIGYEYSLAAKDSSGLLSEKSGSMSAHTYTKSFLEPVKELIVKLDSQTKQIKLDWKYDYKSEDDEIVFVIYKGNDKDKVRRFKILEGSSIRSFIDNDVNDYLKSLKYAIKVFTKSGRVSAMSDIVDLPINR